MHMATNEPKPPGQDAVPVPDPNQDIVAPATTEPTQATSVPSRDRKPEKSLPVTVREWLAFAFAIPALVLGYGYFLLFE